MVALVMRQPGSDPNAPLEAVDELSGRRDSDRTYPMLRGVGAHLTQSVPNEAFMDRMTRQLNDAS
jgi:hypothetical protein